MSRREFTTKTKRAAYQRSGGVCECHRVPMLNRSSGCGRALTQGRVRYEHVIPAELGGDNSIDNSATLTIECWREKTDQYDLPTIVDSNRMRDRARGIKHKTRPLPCGRNSPWKKRMDGTVVRRSRAF